MSPRKYLTLDEVKLLINAVSTTVHPERNRCCIMLAWLHGLRVSELLTLRISDLDYSFDRLFVRRLKNGFSTVHPLIRDEKLAIRKWLSVRKKMHILNESSEDWLFMTRTGKPLSRQQFYNILVDAGIKAGLTIRPHPHMLRHGCGYALADNGIDTRLIQDYLGHRNIRHTVIYTASNSARFERIWDSTRKTKKRHFGPKCQPHSQTL